MAAWKREDAHPQHQKRLNALYKPFRGMGNKTGGRRNNIFGLTSSLSRCIGVDKASTPRKATVRVRDD